MLKSTANLCTNHATTSSAGVNICVLNSTDSKVGFAIQILETCKKLKGGEKLKILRGPYAIIQPIL